MKKLLLLISIPLLFISCSCNRKQKPVNITPQTIKEPMIKVNKSKVQMESEQIEHYIKRHKIPVERSGTGLRYYIYHKGNGPQAHEGQVAKVNFTVKLLNGEEVYSTKETGPQEFLIGMDNVESGLHEGITYMHVGDKAILILPSHLAHGLLGDRNKIPPRSTIIYDIELLELK
ncbi:MAG: peptidylprolyl isomerase [Bacteroidetes bacterium]|nr:MAG: peptidylprolyl isomerase [Bacteroidota bacterium]